MAEETDKTLDIMLDEYRRCADYIHKLEDQGSRLVSIWFTLIAVIFGIGVKENLQPIFLFLPAIVFSILFYTVNIFEMIAITGGYAASLELKINKLVGTRVLKWESQLMPKVAHSRNSLFILATISLSGVLSSIGYSIYRVFKNYPRLVWFQILFASICSCLVVWLVARLTLLHNRTKLIVINLDEDETTSISDLPDA